MAHMVSKFQLSEINSNIICNFNLKNSHEFCFAECYVVIILRMALHVYCWFMHISLVSNGCSNVNISMLSGGGDTFTRALNEVRPKQTVEH